MTSSSKNFFSQESTLAKSKSERLMDDALNAFVGHWSVKANWPTAYNEARRLIALGSVREKEVFLSTWVIGNTIANVDWEANRALDFNSEVERLRLAIMRGDQRACANAAYKLHEIAQFKTGRSK